jgi:predicted phage terminase large subunit-like protein
VARHSSKLPNISAEEAAQELLSRRAAREHLLPFCEYTHPKWRTSNHHRLVCEHLEALERGEIKRLMIHAPRRHSKSEIASRRFPAWFIGRHPDNQVLLASYGDEIAEDLSRNVRNILKDAYFHALFPNVQLATDTTAAGRWETTVGGIFVAAGIGGAATGRGGNLAVIDDPLKGRAEADSPRIREVCWQWYHGVFRLCLMEDAAQLLMCTRWHEDDLAGRLLNTEGSKWTVLNLEAIKNEGTDKEEALWESKYSLEWLRNLKEDLANAGRMREWKSQYQQNPTPEEGIYLKREWMIHKYDERPTNLNIYMASDFAATDPAEGQSPDWTVHGVFGIDSDSRIYVVDWWRGRTSPDVWIDSLLDLVAQWKPRAWFGTKGQIRRMLEPFLLKRCIERKIFFNIEWIAEVVDKSAKGRALQAMASMGRLYFPKYSWAEELIENLVGFPTIKYDDDYDTFALICLALDETHPAMSHCVTRNKKKDPWQKIKSLAKERWKTI